MMICRQCGHQNPANCRFCQNCGAELALPTPTVPTPAPVGALFIQQNSDGARICPACGTTLISDFRFCPSCGVPLQAGKAAPQTHSPSGTLTLVRADGSAGDVFDLALGRQQIGRISGPLFDHDLFLSPYHAEFSLSSDGITVCDLSSLNGVYVQLGSTPMAISSGMIFRIGSELLRFDELPPIAPLSDGTERVGSPDPGYWGRLSVIARVDQDAHAFPLIHENIVMGRERGDVLFPEDRYVSGAHAQLTRRDNQVLLTDLGSSNGTFVRLAGEQSLPSGAMLLLGQQLFRVTFNC